MARCGCAPSPRASRPARGGWIEICTVMIKPMIITSRPARGGWIEIGEKSRAFAICTSRPARGGWIEIVFFAELWDGRTVPPRKGRVD